MSTSAPLTECFVFDRIYFLQSYDFSSSPSHGCLKFTMGLMLDQWKCTGSLGGRNAGVLPFCWRFCLVLIGCCFCNMHAHWVSRNVFCSSWLVCRVVHLYSFHLGTMCTNILCPSCLAFYFKLAQFGIQDVNHVEADIVGKLAVSGFLRYPILRPSRLVRRVMAVWSRKWNWCSTHENVQDGLEDIIYEYFRPIDWMFCFWSDIFSAIVWFF